MEKSDSKVKRKSYEDFFSEIFPAFKSIKPKMLSNKYHCGLCCCPIDQWEPYKDYPSDRSCELFYFLDSLLVKEKGERFTVDEFVKKYEREMRQEFPDLTNVTGVFREHVERQLDVGDIEEVSTGVFVATPWPQRKMGGPR